MVAPVLPSSPTPFARPSAPRVRHSRTVSPATAHDDELVRRFNSGDESAFAEIVSRHRGNMYLLAFRHLRDHGDAEEIAQDTFIRAHRALAGFRGDSSLGSWLHRIALNLAHNRYWYFFRRHRHNFCPFDSTSGHGGRTPLSDLIASEAPTPIREATRRDFSDLVNSCTEKLDPLQRKMLTLRNGSDQSYIDIAQSLGVSVGTVKGRIRRARRNLRELLDRKYAGGESGASPSFEWFEPTRSFQPHHSARG
jgi:RNA polymerase sigma-70 factor, ECF subfamily